MQGRNEHTKAIINWEKVMQIKKEWKNGKHAPFQVHFAELALPPQVVDDALDEAEVLLKGGGGGVLILFG